MPKRVCRTCFQAIKRGIFVQLYEKCGFPDCETISEMLLSIVPETNLAAVVDPVICTNCLSILQTSFKFRTMCLENETRLAEQLQMRNLHSIQLNYVEESKSRDKIKDKSETSDLIPDVEEINMHYEKNDSAAPVEVIEFKTENSPIEESYQDHLNVTGEFPSVNKLDIKTELITVQDKESENQRNKIDEKFAFKCQYCERYSKFYYRIKIHERIHFKVNNIRCDICGKQFVSKANLRIHLLRHSGERPFGCSMCNKSFRQKSSLTLHEKRHIEERVWDCEVSENVVHIESAGATKLISNNVRTVQFKKTKLVCKAKKRFTLICSVCSQKSGSYHEAKLHAKNEHEAQETILCRICNTVFCSKPVYINHSKGHNLKCEVCQKTFISIVNLKRHTSRHLRPKTTSKDCLCDVCGRRFTRSSALLSHKNTHSVKRYKCSECDKTFLSKRLLETHKNVHVSDKNVMCELCGKQFKYASSLLKHKQIRHLNQNKKLLCNICGKTFLNTSSMKTHMIIHSGVKYKCEICDRSFTVISNLKRHMWVHSREKPFVCEICGRGFTREIGLKLHQKSGCTKGTNRQNETSECELCGREFKFKRTLALHRLAHQRGSQFLTNECSICRKTFATINNLRRHMPSHSDVKKHVCEICGKRFAIKPQLVVHIRRHTGEKPFKCQYCEMCFVERGEMKRHEKRHADIQK